MDDSVNNADSEVFVPDSSDSASEHSRSQDNGEGSVTVVGTAHVSEESVQRVEDTIAEEQPDTVAVELDRARYERSQGSEVDEINGQDLISGSTMYQFLAYWLLTYIQTTLGEQFDIEPGADMMAAIDAGEAAGSDIALVDRDIQVTLKRLLSSMSLREKFVVLVSVMGMIAGPWPTATAIGLVFGLIAAVIVLVIGGVSLFSVPESVGIPVLDQIVGIIGPVIHAVAVVGICSVAIAIPIGVYLARSLDDEELEEIDIEEMTDGDMIGTVIEEFEEFSSGGAEALLHERDAHIARHLVSLRDAGHDVVAVVGAAHQPGVERYLDAPDSIPEIKQTVDSGKSSKLRKYAYKGIGYSVMAVCIGFVALLAMAGVQGELLIGLVAAWVIVNGVFAAGLAKLAGAHWRSAGVGGAVAWMTSINPLLAPGWFVGYVELRYTKVSAQDVTRLNQLLKEDIGVMSMLRRLRRDIPTFRLIFAVAMTNLGSVVGTVLFATVLLPYFAADIGGVSGLAEQLVYGARQSIDLIF